VRIGVAFFHCHRTLSQELSLLKMSEACRAIQGEPSAMTFFESPLGKALP
jgi:hypothetical protein